ncbi:MAG: hypothetical protein MI923_11825 [Phycisphaerales bacterium]|nr:hypothetical protein [Phycisphaerales bacterium]
MFHSRVADGLPTQQQVCNSTKNRIPTPWSRGQLHFNFNNKPLHPMRLEGPPWYWRDG